MQSIQFSQFTQHDAEELGLDFSVSPYSMKANRGETLIGYIIFEDKSLTIPSDFIRGIQSEDIRCWYRNVNLKNSIYLRKIKWEESFICTGILEELFDDITYHHLPRPCLIWCIPEVCGESFIRQLGFTEPLHPLPNRDIKLFTIESDC